MASTLPPAAAAAATTTLETAMAEAKISDSPAGPADSAAQEGSEQLEDGEIRDEDEQEEEEEDDGRVKTVFDDARRYNVKVGLVWPHSRIRPAVRLHPAGAG